MDFKAKVDNKEYHIWFERQMIDRMPKIEETDSISNLTKPNQDDAACDICMTAVQIEYDLTTSRSAKLDNKIYILLTVCAFIFTKTLEYVEKVPFVKKIDGSWKPTCPFLQQAYPIIAWLTIAALVITIILFVTCLFSIELMRFDGSIVLTKNMMGHPKKQVVKYICEKYLEITDINNRRLKKRYVRFNWGVRFEVAAIVLLMILACISGSVKYV